MARVFEHILIFEYLIHIKNETRWLTMMYKQLENTLEQLTGLLGLATTMCLGIPMRIVEIDGFNARCEAKGVQRDVSLFMLQHEPVIPGDFVMVHVGYAIQIMSEEEALSAWELYDEVLGAGESGAGDA
jgi:hydrogenase expression/formation protein HypC